MRKPVLHFGFWLVFFLVWNQTLYFYISNVINRIYFSALDVSLIAVTFYSLFYGLMPRYFRHKNLRKLVLSVFLLMASVVIVFAGLMKVGLNHMLVPIHFDFQWNYTDLQYNRFFIALIGISGGCLIRLAVDRLEAQRRLSIAEREKAVAELTYLKAQINPHFLFNSLNGLHAQIDLNRKEAQSTLITLADLLRYQLYECSGEFISLATEVMYLQNYVKLQQLRTDNCTVSFTVNKLPDAVAIAPLLLIPFIENAFKFVSDWTDQENQINITLSAVADRFHFSCLNSVDDCTNTSRTSPGIGLANVRKRLDLLYPGQYDLRVGIDQQNYHVNLLLALRPC